MESLKLTFPSIQTGREFIIDTDPNSVESWLNNLAFVETDQTIHELTRVAHTLNRCPHKLVAREKNFYLLSQGYLTLSRHMREQHDRHKAFVDKQQYKSLHLLSSEMAFGFKRIIDELTSQKMFFKRGRLANAINHAQHYLGLMLIEQYQLYSPIPSFIWRELHLLYEFAEKQRLVDRKLYKETPNPLEPCISIKQSYIRNCLMSVVNPYHIEDNQHWHLFKYLAHWSQVVEITADLERYSQQRCFVLDLSESNKPHIATDDSDYQSESHIRLIKTDTLIATIEKQLQAFKDSQKLPDPGFYDGIEPSNAYKLLERINDFCDTFVARDSTRYPLLTDVDTVWGLTNIKKVILNEKEMGRELELDAELPKTLGNSYKTNFRWRAVNHSEGGICLQNAIQEVDDLRIGNLVILKRYVNNKPQKQWQLAIVRWLTGDKKSGSVVGLEYIHGEMCFIDYLTTNKLKQTVEHPVLLIKPFDSSNPILIAAKNLLGSQKIIQIKVDDEEREARLSHLIETNSKVSIFGLVY
ncbi:hypothetical protein [Kangiella sp. TOML190]|uniref:hypothetical protein n=1 Tax=Kangiella sp. TOML190 TaxID=2931351 RepID=UPI00203CF3E4|nr:hypothetical protein [Kangiella sp. TOML190]